MFASDDWLLFERLDQATGWLPFRLSQLHSVKNQCLFLYSESLFELNAADSRLVAWVLKLPINARYVWFGHQIE
jgi:hypothetical protein